MNLVGDLLIALEEAQAPVRPCRSDRLGTPRNRDGQASGVAALASSRLRSIVTQARQTHGPRRTRWSLRERLAWQELVVTRGEAA